MDAMLSMLIPYKGHATMHSGARAAPGPVRWKAAALATGGHGAARARACLADSTGRTQDPIACATRAEPCHRRGKRPREQVTSYIFAPTAIDIIVLQE
eukprot:6172818-Pleurochrysis_carterae.AAC.6